MASKRHGIPLSLCIMVTNTPYARRVKSAAVDPMIKPSNSAGHWCGFRVHMAGPLPGPDAVDSLPPIASLKDLVLTLRLSIPVASPVVPRPRSLARPARRPPRRRRRHPEPRTRGSTPFSTPRSTRRPRSAPRARPRSGSRPITTSSTIIPTPPTCVAWRWPSASWPRCARRSTSSASARRRG